MIQSASSVGSSVSYSTRALSFANATEPPTVTDQESLNELSLLTPTDWALASAAAGRNVGPNANGQIPGAQPLLGLTIADMRAHGGLAGGQELTVSYLKAMQSPGQPQGFNDQITAAIQYLEKTQGTSPGGTTSSTTNGAATGASIGGQLTKLVDATKADVFNALFQVQSNDTAGSQPQTITDGLYSAEKRVLSAVGKHPAAARVNLVA